MRTTLLISLALLCRPAGQALAAAAEAATAKERDPLVAGIAFVAIFAFLFWLGRTKKKK